jgi:hypothetical protein
MLTQFRKRYPQGSLIGELVQIDHGKYIVRALVQVDGITLATGLASAETIEQAEDQARNRALALLDLNSAVVTHQQVKDSNTQEITQNIQKTEPEKVVAPSVETSDSLRGHFADRVELNLSQDKVQSTETLPLLSNGVSSPPTSDTFTSESPLSFKETVLETPKPEETTPQLPLETASPSPTFNRASVSPSSPLDSMDVITRTDVELKRLGWTSEQGRNYLLETYGKRSRHLLTDEELLEFLHHLERQ